MDYSSEFGFEERPLVCSLAEAAHLLACSEKTIRRMVEAGLLRSVPLLGRRVIPRSALEEYVAGYATEEYAPLRRGDRANGPTAA